MKIARRPLIRRIFLAGSVMLSLNTFSSRTVKNEPPSGESRKTDIPAVSPALLCVKNDRPNDIYYPEAVQKIKKSFNLQGPDADMNAGHLLELRLIMKCYGVEDRDQVKSMWDEVFCKIQLEERRRFIMALPKIFEDEGFGPEKIDVARGILGSIDALRFSNKIEVWIEIVKNRIKDRPDGRPLALIFYPLSRSDWNNAFREDTASILADFINDGYRVMYYEVERDEFFFEQLKKTCDGEQQARAIVIGGHGYKYGLNFSSPQGEIIDTLYLGINDGPKMIQGQLGRALEPGGQVILMSCSTGKEMREMSRVGEVKITNLANVLTSVFTQASHVWAPVEDVKILFIGFDERSRIDWVHYDVEAYDAASEGINKRFLEYGLIGQGSQEIKESLQIFNNMPQRDVYLHFDHIVDMREGVDYKRLLKFFAQYPAELSAKNRTLAKKVVEKVLAEDKPDWNETLLSVIQKLTAEECEGPIFKSLLREAVEFYDDNYDLTGPLLDLDSVNKETIISLVVRQIKDNPKLRKQLRDLLASPETSYKNRRLYTDLAGRIKDKNSIKILKRILGVGLFTWRDKDKELCRIALQSLRRIESE